MADASTVPEIARSAVRVHRRAAFLLLGFFLLGYVALLGAPDLVDTDENRYAEISREMAESGDWVVPHLAGVRYFEKPVLGYWAIAGSMQLFGKTAFAVRFPSALAAGLSALLVHALVRRTRSRSSPDGGSPAVLSALIVLSCAAVWVVGNTATLDSSFTALLTATIASFFFATEAAAGSGRERVYLALSGVACGSAFLTKGLLALAIPVLCLSPYLLWLRRPRDLLRMSWLPILVAVLTVLPWALLIHAREPDFWQHFIWNEHVRRFLEDDAQHGQTFWYYARALPGIVFPWTLLVPTVVPGIRVWSKGTGAEGRLAKLCFSWLVLSFLFFSISRGKLLAYILPCVPPFAILLALGLDHAVREGKSRSLRGGMIATAGLLTIVLLALVYLQTFAPAESRPYHSPMKWFGASAGLLTWIVLCIVASRGRCLAKRLLLFGLAPLGTYFVAHLCIPDRFIEQRVPAPFLQEHAEEHADKAIVISDKNTIHAVCWNWERTDLYGLGMPGELRYGLGYEEAAGRLLDPEAASRLIEENRGRVVLVCRDRLLRRVASGLPPPLRREASGPGGFEIWSY